ncbi:heme exporter protein CcmD [Rhizobium sp. P40RR-XXII]|uniref:heme exporter protein CcmD n=1 Tax=unclassified Rhizobium TaxID=2613769 RepID=UPI001456EEBE|nr:MULTISPECIES: heme exporter protein CcmD [unclassified Rhizobium]NLR89385.1 heme exporter protein CcmD [Rhizobium sp. P28RR-XV]NLS19980.1 heme exporter protein CcmD [Rhizobium sp. P40RR-XXII]
MNHQFYVYSAYAITFLVMSAATARIWLAGRTYRRRVEALMPVRVARMRSDR